MTDRFDDRLDAFLDTGELPPDATVEERAEIESLARSAGLLRDSQDTTGAEAAAAMPVARARFDRFLADEAGRVEAASRPVASRKSWFARFFERNRGLRMAGIAAAVGFLAIVAVFASQNVFDGTESAVAQVLEPGDYAQVYGTVASVSGAGDSRTIEVDSAFGVLEVRVDGATSVVEANSLRDIASIQPGANLLIAGLVGRDRAIAAQTLAFASPDARPVDRATASAGELKRRPPDDFEGQVMLMTLAEDGLRARVVVLAGDGSRYVVRISRLNAGLLLANSTRIIGARIHLIRDAANENLYVARLVREPETPATSTANPDATPADDASPAPTGTAPKKPSAGFARTSGVIFSREANVLTVQTDAGNLQVVIRGETQVIFDDAGLTRGDLLRGETVIGHAIVAQGGIERATGRFIAGVVVVGGKP